MQKSNTIVKKFRARDFQRLLWLSVLTVTAFVSPAGAIEIGFFYALDADLAALKKTAISIGVPRTVNGQTIISLELSNHRIHAVKMESGSVPTALAAATLFSKFACDLALSVGPAGRLDERMSLGEWARITTVIAFQHGAETSTGFTLNANAVRNLDARPFDPSLLLTDWANCHEAEIASGSVFSASLMFRNELRQQFKADLIDMNLAGLTDACAAANVPLLCWKIVSDSADEHASKDFANFCKTYKGEGGTFIADLIKKLPPDARDVSSHPNLRRLMDEGQSEDSGGSSLD